MKLNPTSKDGLGVIGFGAAACVACCAGPILAFLGGVSVAGLASTWLIGAGGFIIAGLAATAFLIVRHRGRRSACAVAPTEPVPVQLLTKAER